MTDTTILVVIISSGANMLCNKRTGRFRLADKSDKIISNWWFEKCSFACCGPIVQSHSDYSTQQDLHTFDVIFIQSLYQCNFYIEAYHLTAFNKIIFMLCMLS